MTIKLKRICPGQYRTEDSRFYATRMPKGYYVTDQSIPDPVTAGTAFLVAICDNLDACKRSITSHLRRMAHPEKKAAFDAALASIRSTTDKENT